MNAAAFRAAERTLWSSVGVEPTERNLSLRRTGCEVRVQEVGSGPPVVFVHGASNCGASWAPLVARLQGDIRALVLDRPGCGLSPPLASGFDDLGRLEAFADDFLADVLDAAGVDDAAVVSTSFGGYFALRGAAAHPHRIGRIVELGWMLGAPLRHMALIMRLSSVKALGRVMTAMPVGRRAARSLLRRVGLRAAIDTGRFPPEALDCYVALLRHTDTMRNEIDAGPRILTLRGVDERVLLRDDLLRRVETPAYFLWGEDDPFGGIAEAQAFVDPLPAATLELVPGAGHAVWIDEPDHTADVVRRFLS